MQTKTRNSVGVIALGIAAILLGACNNPWADSSQSSEISAGRALYEQNCASCHGIEGQGQPNWRSQDANGVFPAPPHTSDGHTWHHADQLLLEIIANGGAMPNSAMPGFGEQFTEDEVAATLAYIKTFWGEEEREFQELVTNQSVGRLND